MCLCVDAHAYSPLCARDVRAYRRLIHVLIGALCMCLCAPCASASVSVRAYMLMYALCTCLCVCAFTPCAPACVSVRTHMRARVLLCICVREFVRRGHRGTGSFIHAVCTSQRDRVFHSRCVHVTERLGHRKTGSQGDWVFYFTLCARIYVLCVRVHARIRGLGSAV